jgi:hypothetical protein
MTKFRWLLILTLLFSFSAAEAQYTIMRVHGATPTRPRYQKEPVRRPALPPFKPSVSLNIGYGFPNLDQNHLAYFYNYYHGNLQQTGPITGSIDYRFSRYMSVGVMATYGKLNTNYYYYYGNNYNPDFYARLESYAIMFNMLNYFPAGKAVSPYLRTAAGVNIWNEEYRDFSGNKLPSNSYPTTFAYQVSLGAKFNLNPNVGLFLEAGYGKYIALGGLSLTF